MLAKERHGSAVEIKDITINAKPAKMDAFKALVDSCAIVGAPGSATTPEDAQLASEVTNSNTLPPQYCALRAQQELHAMLGRFRSGSHVVLKAENHFSVAAIWKQMEVLSCSHHTVSRYLMFWSELLGQSSTFFRSVGTLPTFSVVQY